MTDSTQAGATSADSTKPGGTPEASKPTRDFEFFKGVGRVVFYLALGLTLFFAAAVLILALRQRAPEQSIMPEVVGKFYLDVHNELAREQLRVSLGRRSYPEIAPGLVLHQSIPVGSLIRPRDQLYLVVNQPAPLFEMPRFEGNALQSAQAALARMTHGQRVYSIEAGAIARIPDEAPKDIVLAQFPPPGAPLSVRHRVHFLVSAGPEKGRRTAAASLPELTGMHLLVAADILHRQGRDYRITELAPAERPEQIGLLTKATVPDSGPVQLSVAYSEAPARFRHGYELISIKLGGTGPCEVTATRLGTSEPAETGRTLFRSAAIQEGEQVRVLFFRQGREKVRARCGPTELFSKEFAQEDFS